jgi:hypothetical protein
MALQIGGTTVIDNSRNLVNTSVASATLGSGTASSSTFLRGDRTWQTIPAPPIASTAEAREGTNNTNMMTPLRIREGFNASGAAPVYVGRAWVNFNGTGTVAIRASGNVSSITDNGTGNYTVNFLTAMPDANYAVSGGARRANTNSDCIMTLPLNGTYTTSAVQVITTAATVIQLLDAEIINVTVFR